MLPRAIASVCIAVLISIYMLVEDKNQFFLSSEAIAVTQQKQPRNSTSNNNYSFLRTLPPKTESLYNTTLQQDSNVNISTTELQPLTEALDDLGNQTNTTVPKAVDNTMEASNRSEFILEPSTIVNNVSIISVEENKDDTTINLSTPDGSHDGSVKLRVPLPGYPGFDPNGPTVVLEMGGELANNLGFLAGALVAIWDMEEQGVYPTLVIRHQDSIKWTRGNREVHKCFPWLAQFDFSTGFNKEVNDIITSRDINQRVNLKDHDVAEFLRMYNETRQQRTAANNTDRVLGYINQPVLYVHEMLSIGKHSHSCSKHYHKLQHALQLNTSSTSCCIDRPDPDEIAFHFRDFRTEMSKQWNRKGFWEAGPNRTAVDLLLPLITQQNQSNVSNLESLTPARRVAITSRFGHKDDSLAHQYVEALQRRGVETRIVSANSRTGLQDFCFLAHANTLVGVDKSTFTRYAGFLDPDRGGSKRKQVFLYMANRANEQRRYKLPGQNFVAAPEMERFHHTLLENVTDWRRRRRV